MDIFDRIEKIRCDAGESIRSFSESLSVNFGTIANIKYKKLKGLPSPILLKAICTVYHVNPLWLETGEGEIYDTSAPSDLALEVRDLMHGRPEMEIAIIASLVSMPDEFWNLWVEKLNQELERYKKDR